MVVDNYKNFLIYLNNRKNNIKNIIKSANLSLGVDNLAIFTKYSGYDPEVNSYGNSNSSRGMDRFGYPPSRTYRLNVSLKF